MSVDWDAEASRLLKAEIKRKGMTYGKLAERLSAMGIVETENSLRSKLKRGTYSFVFVLQCAVALDSRDLMFRIELPPVSEIAG